MPLLFLFLCCLYIYFLCSYSYLILCSASFLCYFFLLSLPKREDSLLSGGRGWDCRSTPSKSEGGGRVPVTRLRSLFHPLHASEPHRRAPLHCCCHIFITTMSCLSYSFTPDCSLSFHLCLDAADALPRVTLLRMKSLLGSQSLNGSRINSKSLSVDHGARSDITPWFPPHDTAPVTLPCLPQAVLCSPGCTAFRATWPPA